MKKFAHKAIAGAIASLAFIGAANAAPTCPSTLDPQADYNCVSINIGSDRDGNGSNFTDLFYELGITGTLATSIYLPTSPTSLLGATVIDTNIKSVINSYGFVGNASYANAAGAGPMVNINDTPAFGQRNIDSLNPLDPLNFEANGYGQGGGWRLYFNYLLQGTLTATGPQFNSGFFDIFYDDLTTGGLDNIQVLRVNVTGSTINAANLDLLGKVSFDFDGNGTDDATTAFQQNFWNFEDGRRWWDLIDETVVFKLDTNVNPPIPTPGALAVAPNGRALARQTTLDSSVRFIPEPGTLALLGLGLLGAAAARRRHTA